MIDTLKLTAAAAAAKSAQLSTGLPAQLTLAQWALESGWGKHQPGNNCFGIKTYPGDFGQQELLTTEVWQGVPKKVPQWFATFKTLADCFAKHATLITQSNRYQIYWLNYKAALAKPENAGMYDALVARLVSGIAPIYATDPDYAKKLMAIIAMPEVVAALRPSPGLPPAA